MPAMTRHNSSHILGDFLCIKRTGATGFFSPLQLYSPSDLNVYTVRLKSLEIKGFKSFADKTIVNFDDNITGIVGPNGCGKSNIVDSIRWVIGEQKISQLRSENLDSLV